MMLLHTHRLMAALLRFYAALDDYERLDDDSSYQRMLRARATLRQVWEEARLAQ